MPFGQLCYSSTTEQHYPISVHMDIPITYRPIVRSFRTPYLSCLQWQMFLRYITGLWRPLTRQRLMTICSLGNLSSDCWVLDSHVLSCLVATTPRNYMSPVQVHHTHSPPHSAHEVIWHSTRNVLVGALWKVWDYQKHGTWSKLYSDTSRCIRPKADETRLVVRFHQTVNNKAILSVCLTTDPLMHCIKYQLKNNCRWMSCRMDSWIYCWI